MRVAKWGNSLAVRLPSQLVAELGLKEGDEVDFQPSANRVFEVTREPTPFELLDSLRRYRGILPEDYKFDRDEANER